jgi:hypothetical protein
MNAAFNIVSNCRIQGSYSSGLLSCDIMYSAENELWFWRILSPTPSGSRNKQSKSIAWFILQP